MPVTVDDLIAPKGELSTDWFDDLEVDAANWLQDAVTRTSGFTSTTLAEDAQKAWAYHRGYSFMWSEANVSPAEQRTQETWDRWTEAQIRWLAQQASKWLNTFMSIANQDAGSDSQRYVPVQPTYGRESRR